MPCHGGTEIDAQKQCGGRDDVPFGRLGLGDEERDLRDARGDAEDEQARPALPYRNGRGAGEDERGESCPGCGQLARFEPDGRRREERADQAEARDQLGRPCNGRGDTGRGDPAGDQQGGPIGNEVVQHLRREQRHVRAADSRADRRERRVVQVRETALDVEAGAESERRGDRPERDAGYRADPAAVHREHEEEQDPEEHHGAARPGEGLRAEEH